jgi:hypothetical protein
MLLLGAGFKPEAGSDELILYADQLASIELPDWVQVDYEIGTQQVSGGV